MWGRVPSGIGVKVDLRIALGQRQEGWGRQEACTQCFYSWLPWETENTSQEGVGRACRDSFWGRLLCKRHFSSCGLSQQQQEVRATTKGFVHFLPIRTSAPRSCLKLCLLLMSSGNPMTPQQSSHTIPHCYFWPGGSPRPRSVCRGGPSLAAVPGALVSILLIQEKNL